MRNIIFINSSYFLFEDILSSSVKSLLSGLWIFRINVRSLNKDFEKLKDFLSELSDEFGVWH